MYEDQTYEALLERMLGRVPEGMDKREGSIIYDALAPAAAELAQMYLELEVSNNLFFPDTATGEYLERSIVWTGIARHPASKAQLSGRFYGSGEALLDIPLGSRFSLGLLHYSAVEKLSPGMYRLESEAAGREGNQYSGQLLPIDYIPGLARGEITALLVPGTDAEEDEVLRQRYFASARRPSTSGNKYHYMEWAQQVEGVGGARVFPLWAGPKTVKVVIVDTEHKPASALLVSQVQQFIDPAPGLGEGQAPVGAVVTVESAAGKTISVAARVTLAAGYALQPVINAFSAILEKYRKEKAFTATYISHSVVGALLLDTEGVVDYSGLKLNGGTGNVTLNETEVPLFGSIVLEV
ncbi:baseplate J/gp47 family protein [Paenibacillus sp. MMS20-IR301]|uniref:baseplate J/gp47 family protein n=1 Tax=Paenibacillus sp. MMS20-IR301 TaxID=2895946 RepID=UPI0028E5912B|nr:baseplate J/gp47 family protein [Paenibacillus sp. MMS20-IR301]WNS42851.1 baseplate J/gp47 family protein [Paenibacillus sp. MMS20-IR301]